MVIFYVSPCCGWTTTLLTYSWCVIYYRQNRTAASGNTRGGVLCIFVNNSWCTISKEVSRFCSSEVEYLMISCRSHYLPREFSSVFFIAVYIPPQTETGTKTALNELYTTISKQENAHPEAALLVAGDFNIGKLKSVWPNFYQHVKCATRGKQILDHLYSIHWDAYKTLPHPPFGKSDHNAILLIPAYKQKFKQEAPVTRSIKSSQMKQMLAKLQDCFASTDWNMFRDSADDIEEYTTSHWLYQ